MEFHIKFKDSSAAHLQSHSLGEAQEGSLGHAVGAEERHDVEAADRGHVHDGTATPGLWRCNQIC